jgi:hypothetical protein
MEVLEYRIECYFNSIDTRMSRMIGWCLSCIWWLLNWEQVLVNNVESPGIEETLLKFQYSLIGPQTSLRISCRDWLALNVNSFGKLLRNYLPTKHPPHNWFGCIMNGRPFNISFCAIIFKLSKFICPNLTCQSQVSSFTYAFRHLDTSVFMFSKNILLNLTLIIDILRFNTLH